MSKPILRTSIRQIGGPRLRCLGLRPSCAVSPWRICRSQIRSDHADQSSNYSSAAPSSSSTAPSIPTFPQVVFSGIQPTGIPHLGNYLGALREWVRLQDSPTTAPDAKLIFSIVDLHALTVPQDRDTLRRWRWESLATLAAIGLDVKRCVLFFQSEVAEHSELMWILSTVASMGYLGRMTQWKSKLQLPEDASVDGAEAKAKLRLGLYSYPVLQAADVLVHRATHVPVGEDQKQHLEFARNTANSFNHLFGHIFPAPTPLISPAKRVMSLKAPTSKMSKSDPNPLSRIIITDSPDEISQKIKVALTDSIPGITYDPAERPGVSNLIEMLSHMEQTADGNTRSCEDIARDFDGMNIKALKEKLAQTMIEALTPVRERYAEIMGSEAGKAYLEDVAADGGARARKSAAETMRTVKDSLGLT